MVYTDSCSWHCRSYVNNFETRCGGSHCDGFRAGLADVYNKFLKDCKPDSEQIKINGDDASEGLCAVIKVSVPEFNYDPHVEPAIVKTCAISTFCVIKSNYTSIYLTALLVFSYHLMINAHHLFVVQNTIFEQNSGIPMRIPNIFKELRKTEKVLFFAHKSTTIFFCL